MDSSAGWLLLGPKHALALQLVEAGFDVWMGNARGNRYSRNHTTLTPGQPAFWAWSWQQQAEYDLPASIDYVLEVTQQQKLVLVGYSQVRGSVSFGKPTSCNWLAAPGLSAC
jgi:lysosomal acid lipase/cholesteryl ester hydrolase